MTEPVGLILDGHRDGATNMAIDEHLLREARPVVRFYGWRPATVSLGRSQSEDEVDVDAIRSMGYDLVHRVTGGGAILHDEAEVTYSVVLPHDHPDLPRDIPGSFTFLSRGVQLALRELGLDVAVGSSSENTREALCYMRHQGTNLFVGPRKVSGGAQRRTDAAVLQHGTVIVQRDADVMARLFGADAVAVRQRVTSLRDENVRVSRGELVDHLVDGYAEALGARFEERDAPTVAAAVKTR